MTEREREVKWGVYIEQTGIEIKHRTVHRCTFSQHLLHGGVLIHSRRQRPLLGCYQLEVQVLQLRQVFNYSRPE